MKLSVFTVSIPEWTRQEAVTNLAAQGWDGVEWRIGDQRDASEPGFWAGNRATWPLTGLEDLIPEMVEMTRAAGLEISGFGGYVPAADREGAARMLRLAAAARAPRARLLMPPLEPGTYIERFAATRADLEALEPLALDLGVQILVELHHGLLTESASAALRLVEGLDPAAVGVIHDLGNLVIEGWEDPAAAFELLGPYLAHVHLKNARWVVDGAADDLGGAKWVSEWAPLREGQADVLSYLRALVAHGYDGWITLEDFSTRLPMVERTADNLAYVSALLAEAGGARG